MTLPAATPTETVDFVAPMLGLSPYTTFALAPVDGADGLYALRSREADVRLFVIEAAVGVPDYAPRLPASALEQIGAAAADDVQVLVVANPSDEGIHLNLRAPVLVHPASGRAVQAILDDQDYPLRARLGG